VLTTKEAFETAVECPKESLKIPLSNLGIRFNALLPLGFIPKLFAVGKAVALPLSVPNNKCLLGSNGARSSNSSCVTPSPSPPPRLKELILSCNASKDSNCSPSIVVPSLKSKYLESIQITLNLGPETKVPLIWFFETDSLNPPLLLNTRDP